MPLPSRVSDLTGFDLLLSVARTGSIGRAAAEHGISQPAASARVRLLEGQLGLALVERSPRGSRLRIAASMTVAEYLLPVWLTALRVVDPGAVVALSAVNSAEVAQAVLADAADIGFIEGPGIPDGLHAEPVGRDAARGPGHRRGPEPHAPGGVDRGPPSGRPGQGPLRDRGPVGPPRPSLTLPTRAHSRANQDAGAWAGGAMGQLAWAGTGRGRVTCRVLAGRVLAGRVLACRPVACRRAAVASASVPT